MFDILVMKAQIGIEAVTFFWNHGEMDCTKYGDRKGYMKQPMQALFVEACCSKTMKTI